MIDDVMFYFLPFPSLYLYLTSSSYFPIPPLSRFFSLTLLRLVRISPRFCYLHSGHSERGTNPPWAQHHARGVQSYRWLLVFLLLVVLSSFTLRSLFFYALFLLFASYRYHLFSLWLMVVSLHFCFLITRDCRSSSSTISTSPFWIISIRYHVILAILDLSIHQAGTTNIWWKNRCT